MDTPGWSQMDEDTKRRAIESIYRNVRETSRRQVVADRFAAGGR